MKPDELYQYAVSLLARKDYSHGEMRWVLSDISDDNATVEHVIARLRDSNYLNDRRIAENILSRLIQKHYGPLRLRQELRQKGIAQDVTEQVLNDCDVDWFQMAAQCRIKKFGELLPSEPKEKARQMRFLQSHGFTMEMIIDAITPSQD